MRKKSRFYSIKEIFQSNKYWNGRFFGDGVKRKIIEKKVKAIKK